MSMGMGAGAEPEAGIGGRFEGTKTPTSAENVFFLGRGFFMDW